MTTKESSLEEWGYRVERLGHRATRFGVILVLFWIGGMKFTDYEAQGIQGFIRHSPFFFWMNDLFSVRAASSLIGIVEIATAILIGLRPLSARASMLGSAMAAGTFAGTLSFLVTTPGVIEPMLGFPGLSVVPGQFLLKDVVLFGAALVLFGESLQANRNPHK